jgi:hypothetical protein
MDGFFSGLVLADVRQDLARNIVSLRVSENLFDDLSLDPAEQATAMQLEMATKPPTYASNQPVIDRPFEEAEWIDAIGFPFIEWAASRYSDGRFGVWYGAGSIETTVFETVYHWRRKFLHDAGFTQDGIVGERKVYWVQCHAALIDLRDRIGAYPALMDKGDYGFTQAIGIRLHHEGHPGLITRSARCDGDVYAAFTPQVLSTPRIACYLTYRTAGDQVEVEKEIGSIWMTI